MGEARCRLKLIRVPGSHVSERASLDSLLVSSPEKVRKERPCVEVEPGMVLDINKEGGLIGIELLETLQE